MRKKLDRLELNLKLQAVALESLLEDIKEIQNKLSEIELLSGEEHN